MRPCWPHRLARCVGRLPRRCRSQPVTGASASRPGCRGPFGPGRTVRLRASGGAALDPARQGRHRLDGRLDCSTKGRGPTTAVAYHRPARRSRRASCGLAAATDEFDGSLRALTQQPGPETAESVAPGARRAALRVRRRSSASAPRRWRPGAPGAQPRARWPAGCGCATPSRSTPMAATPHGTEASVAGDHPRRSRRSLRAPIASSRQGWSIGVGRRHRAAVQWRPLIDRVFGGSAAAVPTECRHSPRRRPVDAAPSSSAAPRCRRKAS